MKNSLRNLFLVVLSALLVFSSVILLLPQSTAKAEGLNDTKNGLFEITGGARLNPKGVLDPDVAVPYIATLGYQIKLKNVDFGDLAKRIGEETFRNLGTVGAQKVKDIYYDNIFTLYRIDALGSKTAIQSVIITYSLEGGGFDFTSGTDYIYRSVLVKQLSYVDGEDENYKNGIDYIYDNDCFTNDDYVVEESKDYTNRVEQYIKQGYTIKQHELVTYDGWIFNYKNEQPSFNISVATISPYVEYYIDFTYDYKEFEDAGIFNAVYKNLSGSLKTDSRSVFYILNAMNNDGILEDYFIEEHSLTVARKIIEGGTEVNKVNITVKWLVPIKGTPFSVRESANITVPMYNSKLLLEDVYSALGVKTLDCYNAHVKEFVKEGNDYVANYYKSSWLRATVDGDGNSLDYFYDMNKSFEDFFSGVFIGEQIDDESCYEYMWSSLLSAYPQLAPYQTAPGQVYGVWGMAVIPKSYSMLNILSELFTAKSEKGEHVGMFSYEALLTVEQYDAIMKRYEYTFLQRIWGLVEGFGAGHEAEFYLFYMDPNSEMSWIGGEPPSKDNPKTPLLPGLPKIIDDIGDVFDNVWGSITGILKTPTGLVSVVVIVLAGFVIFKFVIPGGKSGGKRRR